MKSTEEEKRRRYSGVGHKVKKLIGEGKPRKQAVAIALSMARRDQLGPKGGYHRKKKG